MPDYDQISSNTLVDAEKMNTSMELKEILNLQNSVTRS